MTPGEVVEPRACDRCGERPSLIVVWADGTAFCGACLAASERDR